MSTTRRTPRQLTPFRVFVASPGDLTDERKRIKALEKELREDAKHAGFALEISDWHDVGASVGRPQGVIFSQLRPEEWDVFVGLLWQRFGTPSGAVNPSTGAQFESGTEEEFHEAMRLHRDNDGRPRVLPYRCVRPIPPKANYKQLGAVQEFFEKFEPGQPYEGLVGEFETIEELATKVSAQLRAFFREGSSPRTAPTRAPVTRGALDEAAYRAHIRKHYRLLDIEAIGGEAVYRDVELQAVFIPQHARDCREWLPEKLEAPGALTLDLAELHEHKRFHDAAPRPILGLLADSAIPRRVILGAPGAGKTSLTRIRLVDWEKEPAARELPLLVELRRFHRSGRKDFLDYLANDEDLLFHFPAELLRDRLAAGGVEVVFDGLDEIFEPEPRERVARQIAAFAEEFPQARILVTSRLIGYPGRTLRDAGFAHWLLADFDDAQVAEFIAHWTDCAIREPGDRPIVRTRLEDALKSPVLRELAGNPLLLTLMAVLARESDLPRDLGTLYEQAAALLLKQWDARRYLATKIELGDVVIDQKDKHDLLRDLAWEMQTGQHGLKGNLIPGEKVRAAIDAALRHRIADDGKRRQATDLLIEQLTGRNYLLCHVGGAQFAFVHRGFLEFFASEYLVNIVTTRPKTALKEIGKVYRSHAGDDAWQEVLILAATRFDAGVADKVLLPLVTRTNPVRAGEAAWLRTPHRFVLVCKVIERAREPSKLTTTSGLVRGSLQKWVIDPEADDLALPGLVKLLADTFTDEGRRRILKKVARQNGNTGALQAVVSLAGSFNDSDTRTFLEALVRRKRQGAGAAEIAIAVLAENFGDARTRALLYSQVQRTDDTELRAQAVASLAMHFGDPQTRTLLKELARREEDTDARSQAVASLAEHFGDAQTRALLEELARREEDTRARRQAIESLAERFRADPETAEVLRVLAATPGGRVAMENALEHYIAEEAKDYLRSFLPGEE